MPKARRTGSAATDEARALIGNSKVLQMLIDYAEGKREMSATQVTVALGLLKKIMPDLPTTQDRADGAQESASRYVARVPHKADTSHAWQKQNAPRARH